MSIRSGSSEVESVKTYLTKIWKTGDDDQLRITWKAAREGSTSAFMSLPRIPVAGCGLRFRSACSTRCDGWSGGDQPGHRKQFGGAGTGSCAQVEGLIVRFEEAAAGASDPEIIEALPQSCGRSPPRRIRCHMS
jgi:hypothetical protein